MRGILGWVIIWKFYISNGLWCLGVCLGSILYIFVVVGNVVV